MTDIITYIVVFGFILLGVVIWQARSSKPRPYWLSHQIYPSLKLWIQVVKKDGKHKYLIIKVETDTSNNIKKPYFELINSNREKLIVQIPENTSFITENIDNMLVSLFKIDFNEFSKTLKNNDFKFATFRICVEDKNHKVYKSHALAFDKKWTIFKPDSGTYN